jgi:transposase
MLGFWAPWLAHELRNVGLKVVCLDTRHARAALKMHNRRFASESEIHFLSPIDFEN